MSRTLGGAVRGVSAAVVVSALALVGAGTALAAPAYVPVESGFVAMLPAGVPPAVAFSPSGGSLAVAESEQVQMLSASSNGSLTEVSGSPFSTGAVGGEATAFSPDGSLLATANHGNGTEGSGTLSMFSVASDGELTALSGSPKTVAGFPDALAFSPNGEYLADSDSTGDVSTFRLAPGASGGLIHDSTTPSSVGQPGSVSFNDSSTLLAVGGSGGVGIYTLDSEGVPTPVSSFTFGANATTSVAFDPNNGALLAVTDPAAGTVHMFSVAGEALTQVPGSPFQAGAGATSAAFSADGSLLAVADDGEVSVFSVASNGSLTPLPGSPFDLPEIGAGSRLENVPAPLAFNSNGLLAVGLINATTIGPYGLVDILGPVPSATVSSPAGGLTYVQGASAPTRFSCSVPLPQFFADALVGCKDSNGVSSFPGTQTVVGAAGNLNTSKPGTFSYTVTATAEDGVSSTATIQYYVRSRYLLPIKYGGPAHVFGDLAHVGVSCPKLSGGVCAGVLRLFPPSPTAPTRGARVASARRRAGKLGSAKFSVAAGHTKTIKVRLTKRALKLLEAARHHRLEVRLLVKITGGEKTSWTITLVRGGR